jgi:hypothetical protein
MDVEPAHTDDLVYSFGTGDGSVHTWTSPLDRDVSGDGVLDALTLDFDGDGHRDDAMWDSDGDGRADLVVVDADGEYRVYSDTGRGLWDHRVHDVGPPLREQAAIPPPSASPTAPTAPAVPAEPAAPTAPDGVGLVFPAGSSATPVRVLVDLDADDQVDAALVDSDADGVADRWLLRGDPAFADGTGREDEPLRSAAGRRDERG